jgi:hypothetical protein
MRAPSVTKYIPVTSGKSLPDIWRQGSTDIYIHQGSTSQQKRKEYVPITLRTFTLLGFAVICLGIIAVLEVLVRTSLAKPYGGFIKRDATEWPGPDSDTAYEPYRHVISEKQKLRFERAIAGRAESSSLSVHLLVPNYARRPLIHRHRILRSQKLLYSRRRIPA